VGIDLTALLPKATGVDNYMLQPAHHGRAKPVAARRCGAGHAAPGFARIEGAGQQPRSMTDAR
jgi:hypothetical protein